MEALGAVVLFQVVVELFLVVVVRVLALVVEVGAEGGTARAGIVVRSFLQETLVQLSSVFRTKTVETFAFSMSRVQLVTPNQTTKQQKNNNSKHVNMASMYVCM